MRSVVLWVNGANWLLPDVAKLFELRLILSTNLFLFSFLWGGKNNLK